MNIEQVKIDKLIPYARNSRTHSDGQVAQIAASIKEFGFTNPVLIDETGSIIAGHGRVMAARKLALSDIPSIRLTHLTDAQKKAYVIADNKLALNAGWDDAMLAVELSDLQDMGFDLDLTGFSTEEIEALLAPVGTEGLTDEDAVPEVPDAPVTVLGDVWLLGKHRVMCGDSTSIDAVEKLMNGQKALVMVTDPPYGVNLDQSWRDKALGDKKMGLGNRNIVANDDRSDWTEVWQTFNGDVAYVWHADKFSDVVMASLRAAGFDICQQLIWNKSIMVMGRNDYHFKHEPCWYAVRKGKNHGWIGDRKQTTVIEAKSPNRIMSGSDEVKTKHPTQKPVNCMAYLMRNHGGDVYDPFLGSGTTLIAAEQLGRKCYGMELDPKYCDVIVLRWQEFTGQTATLESNGNPFISLKKAA